MLTAAHHLYSSRTTLIQSMPSQPVSLKSTFNIMLLSMLRSSKLSFLQLSPSKPCIHISHDPSSLSLFIWSPQYLVKSAHFDAPHYVIFSDLLLLPPPSIPTLFPNTFSPCSSLNARDKVSPLYSTHKTQNNSSGYVTILRHGSEMNVNTFSQFNLLLIYSCVQFWSVDAILKYMNSTTFLKDMSTIFSNKQLLGGETQNCQLPCCNYCHTIHIYWHTLCHTIRLYWHTL